MAKDGKSVSAGEPMRPGRTYGYDWATYQATGGYKALPDKAHRYLPQKTEDKQFQRKIGQWSTSVAKPKGADIDVMAGSMNRKGTSHGKR